MNPGFGDLVLLSSVPVENFAVTVIVSPLGVTCLCSLPAFRVFPAISFSVCSLGHHQHGFVYLALFNIFMFLHIHNLSSVLEIFSATASLNIGPPSFLLLLLICSIFLSELFPHKFLQLCLPDHQFSVQVSLIGYLTQPLTV